MGRSVGTAREVVLCKRILLGFPEFRPARSNNTPLTQLRKRAAAGVRSATVYESKSRLFEEIGVFALAPQQSGLDSPQISNDSYIRGTTGS